MANVTYVSITQDTSPAQTAANSRTDLTNSATIPLLVDTSGNCYVAWTNFVPASVTLPQVMVKNAGTLPITMTYKVTHGGSSMSAIIPAGAIGLYPQVDYTTPGVFVASSGGSQMCYVTVSYANT